MNHWRRDILIASVGLPGAVNIVATLVAARFLGIEALGLWLAGRSVCQLTVNLHPGWPSALPVLVPQVNQSSGLKLEAAAGRLVLPVSAGVLMCLVAIAVAIDIAPSLIGAFACYWVALFVAGHTGLIARGRCDGRLVARGSAADIIGGLAASAVALSGSLLFFVLSQAVRMAAKGAAQWPYHCPPPYTYARSDAKDTELLSVGFPMMVKGWIQTAVQYGDRIVIGMLFGASIVGLAGLGSSLALPVMVVSSATAAWMLPTLLKQSEVEAQVSRVNHEIATLSLLGVGFALILPTIGFAVPEAVEGMGLVVAGYLLISSLALINVVSVVLVARGRLWTNNVVGVSVFGAAVLTLLIAAVADVPPLIALVVAAVVVTGMFLIVLRHVLGAQSKWVGAGPSISLVGFVSLLALTIEALPMELVPLMFLAGSALLVLAGVRVVTTSTPASDNG